MHVVKQNTVASLIAIETSFLANCLRDQRREIAKNDFLI